MYLCLVKIFINYMIIFRYIKSKIFIINLVSVVALLMLSFWLVGYGIDEYTSHNEEVVIPNILEMDSVMAQKVLDSNNLILQIIDSVHLSEVEKGNIVEQTPVAGELIKENRKIFVVINAFTQERIKMPNLVGTSIRQAITDAETYGLKIGEKKYVPDFAMNYVLKQYYKGEEINAGTVIPKGSYIDLEIGKGLNSEKIPVPNLIGLNYLSADSVANNAFINISGVFYDEDVKTKIDTENAVVYKQDPMPTNNNKTSMGSFIDIWLTTNKSLVPEIIIDTTITNNNTEDEEEIL